MLSVRTKEEGKGSDRTNKKEQGGVVNGGRMFKIGNFERTYFLNGSIMECFFQILLIFYFL